LNGFSLYRVELELHGVFWFHSYAQISRKYVHHMLPVVHNYPLTLAFLSLPSEQYASVSGIITYKYKPEDVWRKYGIYVYPAVFLRNESRILTFTMTGTGYVDMKVRTRASVPDFTANQVSLPGTVLKTYVLVSSETQYKLPGYIRLGSKRYGVFRVKPVKLHGYRVVEGSPVQTTHPFNVRDAESLRYYSIMNHYAGPIAVSGIVRKSIQVGNDILAYPVFFDKVKY